MKSGWPVKQVLTIPAFRSWAPWWAYRYFSEDATYAVLFRERASINYQNIIKSIRSFYERVILFWGDQLMDICFEIRKFMFVFTKHRPMIENYYILNMNKISPTVQAVARDTSVHTDIRHSKRRRKERENTYSGWLKTCKSGKISSLAYSRRKYFLLCAIYMRK